MGPLLFSQLRSLTSYTAARSVDVTRSCGEVFLIVNRPVRSDISTGDSQALKTNTNIPDFQLACGRFA
jgi:hypothetical protein